MATVEQCDQALHGLAERLAAKPASRRTEGFDRSLSCTLRDLEVTFTGRLRDGQLVDITQVDRDDAQVRLRLGSDDLIGLVNGNLNLATAWATGRIKVDASMRDLLKLRSIF